MLAAKGKSEIQRLPPYLTVQMVRFFYKVDVQQKAKILRKVLSPPASSASRKHLQGSVTEVSRCAGLAMLACAETRICPTYERVFLIYPVRLGIICWLPFLWR